MSLMSKKRKVATTEEKEDEFATSDSEFEGGRLEGVIDAGSSGEEDDSEFDSEEDEFDDDEEDEEDEDSDLDSDDIPSPRNGEVQRNGLKENGELGSRKMDKDEDRDEYANRDFDSEAEDLPPGTRIVTDSAGKPRYMYPEIDPVYDSDDSAPEDANTIGDIPLNLYDAFPHIGYDLEGRKIMRPAMGKALDKLLESVELPKGWTGLVDRNTGKPLKLSDEELEIVAKIQGGLRGDGNEDEEGYDPYEPMVEWFSSKLEIMPLSSAPEPKRRFVPSKHEAKRIMKIVRAIREGRIVPHKPKEDKPQLYDIWADESAPRIDKLALPAPKLPPPTHDESYNPPPEYLPTSEEKKKWEEEDPEDRTKDYLPKSYSALRLVPGYDRFVKERFERCLDLYLAPRVRRKKLNIDPDSLLPKLPSLQDLKPFPTTCATIYRGHEGRVRAVSVDPSGVWLASGGDDGTIRVWEILTGREVWKARIGKDEAVNAVKWRPGREGGILAAAAGEDIYLLVPPIFDPETDAHGRELIAVGWGYAAILAQESTSNGKKKEPAGTWTKPTDRQSDQGVGAIISIQMPVKTISWHRRGDYFVTVSPQSANSRSVLIHHLPKHTTVPPFRRAKGLLQHAAFHPSKPHLYVSSQRYIRVYDLSTQTQLRTLLPGSKWISSFDIHGPSGDHVIVGSYDRRLTWHDLDVGQRPHKTMRYHKKAIRDVAFHPGGGLFASASDDAEVQVFWCRVSGELDREPEVVPVKVLRGHEVAGGGLGVLCVEWHVREAWLFSGGADGTVRLWN